MIQNTHQRDKPWKIGSFTKNFRWGEYPNSLKQLHVAINAGFDRNLTPVLRSTFRQRISEIGLIDYIPANFFVFNQVIGGESYVVVDELIYQAISFPHSRQFDRLATFTLILSEVGFWKGAEEGQSQPSDWARFFVIDQMSNLVDWKPSDYSRSKIEAYLSSRDNFEGHTTKLATNLSFFFNSGDLAGFPDEESNNWLSNSIFLALDRYYLLEKPDKVSLSWCLDTLQRNKISDIAGPETEFKISSFNTSARLFSSVLGIDRFDQRGINSGSYIFAVLSRKPALVKVLPALCAQWISSRLFVEIALDDVELEQILNTDYQAAFKEALARTHNQMPPPQLSGDEIIALFRGEDEHN